MTVSDPGANAPDPSSVSIQKLGDEIAELSAYIQAATCQLLTKLAEMDRCQGYGDLGFKSCAGWLSWRTGESIGTAREKVRVARKLVGCTVVLQAFSEGKLSYSKVRAITRIVTPQNEQTLLEQALDGSTSQLERVVRCYRRCVAADKELATRQHDRRFLSWFHDEDNMLVLRGRLPPEVGAVLVKALQVATEAAQADSADLSQQRCDALAEVAGAALDQGLAERQGKARPNTYQVLVHVDQAVLSEPTAQGRCEVEGAVGVSAETFLRLSCDAPALELPAAGDGCCDGSKEGRCKLELGRSRRRASSALERAVRTRDHGVCQFPGCECRGYLQLHHVRHWAHGGPTELENLSLICRAHHRLVHEGGFSMDRGEDGAFRFYNPFGESLSPSPPQVSLPRQPVQALLEQHQDLDITQDTGRPTWPGVGRVDYGWAVDALLVYDDNAAEN